VLKGHVKPIDLLKTHYLIILFFYKIIILIFGWIFLQLHKKETIELLLREYEFYTLKRSNHIQFYYI